MMQFLLLAFVSCLPSDAPRTITTEDLVWVADVTSVSEAQGQYLYQTYGEYRRVVQERMDQFAEENRGVAFLGQIPDRVAQVDDVSRYVMARQRLLQDLDVIASAALFDEMSNLVSDEQQLSLQMCSAVLSRRLWSQEPWVQEWIFPTLYGSVADALATHLERPAWSRDLCRVLVNAEQLERTECERIWRRAAEFRIEWARHADESHENRIELWRAIVIDHCGLGDRVMDNRERLMRDLPLHVPLEAVGVVTREIYGQLAEVATRDFYDWNAVNEFIAAANPEDREAVRAFAETHRSQFDKMTRQILKEWDSRLRASRVVGTHGVRCPLGDAEELVRISNEQLHYARDVRDDLKLLIGPEATERFESVVNEDNGAAGPVRVSAWLPNCLEFLAQPASRSEVLAYAEMAEVSDESAQALQAIASEYEDRWRHASERVEAFLRENPIREKSLADERSSLFLLIRQASDEHRSLDDSLVLQLSSLAPDATHPALDALRLERHWSRSIAVPATNPSAGAPGTRFGSVLHNDDLSNLDRVNLVALGRIASVPSEELVRICGDVEPALRAGWELAFNVWEKILSAESPAGVTHVREYWMARVSAKAVFEPIRRSIAARAADPIAFEQSVRQAQYPGVFRQSERFEAAMRRVLNVEGMADEQRLELFELQHGVREERERVIEEIAAAHEAIDRILTGASNNSLQAARERVDVLISRINELQRLSLRKAARIAAAD